MAIKNKVHLKNKIVVKMRQLSREWQPIIDAENSAKRDKSTFECAGCGVYIYTGDSKKSFESLKEKYDNVIQGTLYKDHIDPVIPIDRTQQSMTLDELSDRIFCEIDNIQILCKDCHDIKSKLENLDRKEKKS